MKELGRNEPVAGEPLHFFFLIDSQYLSSPSFADSGLLIPFPSLPFLAVPRNPLEGWSLPEKDNSPLTEMRMAVLLVVVNLFSRDFSPSSQALCFNFGECPKIIAPRPPNRAPLCTITRSLILKEAFFFRGKTTVSS